MTIFRVKELRGGSRRNFLRWGAAAAAVVGLDRVGFLNFLCDTGGSAMADEASCNTTNRSVHLVGGNGSFAWFQLFWPHIEVAKAGNSSFAYHAPGQGMEYLSGDRPFFYGPEAPWTTGGMPKPGYEVTGLMAGENETHTQTPKSAAMVTSGTSMMATVASIQRATVALLPVIGVAPANLGVAPGAPALATVPDANGMVDLFNSAASQLTLAADEDKALFEIYYKAIIGMRLAAGRPTWTRHIETGKTAANLLGKNLASQLKPMQADLDMYGITSMLASNIPSAAKTRLENLGRALITTKKAFTLGLTNSVIIGVSPNATSEQLFTDPHDVFNNIPTNCTQTCQFFGGILNAFYLDLEASADPACSAKNLGETTVMTVHGDTPHTPLQASAWPDATPGNSNWLYVLGKGHLKTGWFGGVHADGNVDGFDPATGATMPGQPAIVTSNPAGAAVAYAVAKGNLAKVKEYYNGDISGIIV